MLPTLFNIYLSIILLLTIVVTTVVYVCKLRSPAHRRLPHANSPGHRHSNAQSPVAVHHKSNPITSIPPTNTPIHVQHAISIFLNFGTCQGSFAKPPEHMDSQLIFIRQPTYPCRKRCFSCQSFGRLMSRSTSARSK